MPGSSSDSTPSGYVVDARVARSTQVLFVAVDDERSVSSGYDDARGDCRDFVHGGVLRVDR